MAATNGHRRTNRLGGYPGPAAARPASGRRPAMVDGLPTGIDTVLSGLRLAEPRSLGEMVDAMRRDYQVSFADTVLQANLSSAAVTVSSETNDPRAEAICESLQDLWERHLTDMGKAIGDGRVAFQKRWDFDAKCGISVIRRLDSLPFRQTEMLISDDGCFEGIKLTGKPKMLGKPDKVTITPDIAWWLALDATVIEPHGRSRYLGALQEEWTHRREIFELRMKFLRKFCLRGGVMRGPATTIDPKTNTHIATATALAGAFDALRQGGMMFLPDVRNKDGHYQFDWVEPDKLTDPSPIDATVDKSDVRVLRALGISELAVQQAADLGSFAMAVMHRLILNAVIGGILGQFVDSFDLYVVAKVLEANYYDADRPDVSVTYPDLTAVPDSLMVELAKAILTAPQLPPAAALINLKSVFEIAGVPITDDFDQRLAKAMATAAQQQQAIQLPGQFNPQRTPVAGTEPAPRAMANAATSLADDTLAGEIPTSSDVLFAAQERAAALYGRLFTLAAELRAAGPFDRSRIENEINTTFEQIRNAAADAQTTIRVLGMLSPWIPRVQDAPQGSIRPRPITMALEDRPAFDWPFMTDAIDFLRNRQVVTQDQFDTLSRTDRQNVFAMPEVNDARFLADIRNEIATSIGSGESLENFRERMQQRIGLQEAQINTLFRTNTHQAYLEGQERTLESPSVAELFPYVMYAATRDTRTDPAHSAVDGFVVRRGTAEHRVLLKLLRRYNCRCALIPLSADDAGTHGIKTYADLPAIVLDAVDLVSNRTFTLTN